MVKAEEKATEIPYKIITVTVHLLHIKAMQDSSWSYERLRDIWLS